MGNEATGRSDRAAVPTPPPAGSAPRTEPDDRRLINEIKANIAKKKPINSEKQSLINRAKLLGVTFTENPNKYTNAQIQSAIQNYWKQSEYYRPSPSQQKKKAQMYWRDWATQPLSIAEQYGIVGLSGQGDTNNRHFLLNSLAAKYAYLPVSDRPTPLLGKWLYERGLSTFNVAVYRHRSRKEIKIGIRGTKSNRDLVTDTFVFTGAVGVTKYINNTFGYDSYVVRVKNVIDATLAKYPRPEYEYSMTGHSLAGLACVFMNIWLQSEYLAKNAVKSEDKDGEEIYTYPKGTVPYKHMQITTFDAGAGGKEYIAALNNYFKKLTGKVTAETKSKKSSKVKLRQYRTQGDLVSLTGQDTSAYGPNQVYSMSFKPRCKEQEGFQLGGEGHGMNQFIHNVFLPPDEKIKCKKFNSPMDDGNV